MKVVETAENGFAAHLESLRQTNSKLLPEQLMTELDDLPKSHENTNKDILAHLLA